MITHASPAPLLAPPRPGVSRGDGQEPAPRPAGAWRYACPRRPVGLRILAVVVSVALHAGIFFGIGRPKPRPVRVAEKTVIALALTMPQLKDLEEPEPVLNDDAGAKPELGEPAPMLADLPQIPLPSDFVQQIDFSSFVERPDFSKSAVWTIPENIRRGGKPGDGAANIFNLADLDRVPVALFQPPPEYPMSMKREGLDATVLVEFIVDVQGRVAQAIAVKSSYSGFEASAVEGVQKWRFRPGQRGGLKVNTRMSVPIIFTVRTSG